MMNVKVMTEREQETIIRVNDDIRVAQDSLLDDELLYDEDNFELNRATEALLYGAYNDDIGYVMKGLDILKEFTQRVEGFETKDYGFNDYIDTLQKVINRHIKR